MTTMHRPKICHSRSTEQEIIHDKLWHDSAVFVPSHCLANLTTTAEGGSTSMICVGSAC